MAAAAANQCLLGWDEWRIQMLEKRRRRWRERVMMRVRARHDEVEDMSSEEVGVSEDEEEDKNYADEKGEEETVMEVVGMEEGGETEVGWRVKDDKEVEREVTEADERADVEEEEEEGEVEIGVKENADEEEEVKKPEEEEEVEVERDIKKNGEVEIEEREEKENEAEKEVGAAEELDKSENVVDEGEDRWVREEEQVEEGDDGEEEYQLQKQVRQYNLADQLREHMRRVEREQKRLDEENVSESDSDDEDSDLMAYKDEFFNFDRLKIGEGAVLRQYEDPEELEDPDEKLGRRKNNVLGEWTSKERKEVEDKRSKLSTDDKVEESWTTLEEELHAKLQKEEEEFTDDEEGEHSTDEEFDSNDEDDVVKIFGKEDYHTDIFHTLTEFRDSSLLTDLTLSTEDGRSVHVHSPVLAAVSSHIREILCRSNVDGADERKDACVGNHRWSVSLGPEVDHVGLKAVVEFAYTGLISCLDKNTLEQVKAAAQTLGAHRVLDLCKDEEEKSVKIGGQKKVGRISAAEQMRISLVSIKQLWTERVGCDVTLEALGGSLHVHRVILAVCSDFFRGMFTLGMRESHQPCVTLPFLLASELEVLTECSYTGALPLSWKCVFEITSTALQLQYQPALSLCLNFLHQEINPHSCLDVASFAEAYEMTQLLEVADDFVLRQFQKVASVSKFKDLPAKKLFKYLSSRSLCVPSELVVFKAVVAWIQAKPKKRLKLAKELMKTINFPLMTFKEFKEVQSTCMWSDHSLVELYEAIFEDFCSNESQCRVYLPKESLVLIGGDQISEDLGSRSISRELWFGNSLRNHTGVKKTMEWRKLGEMPEPERFGHEVAFLKGQLYVFGGKKYYGINDTLNSVYRFDPLQNSWETLAAMQEKRCSFSVVVLDGKIYAIGGHCTSEYLESVEQYCPTGNSWRFMSPLDLPLAGHVARVLQGQIFVSGGLTSDYQYLSSMFLYHPETGSTYLANMAKPRARHCMETLDECLYVAGGLTTDHTMGVVDQLACEMYNPVADTWTAFTSLPMPHVGAGGAILEGKFYVLGGYSQDYNDTKTVHRYDPATQRWENMGKMPGPNSDIRASVLCLPPHFRL